MRSTALLQECLEKEWAARRVKGVLIHSFFYISPAEQDGNQETRHHAKAAVAVLLDTVRGYVHSVFGQHSFGLLHLLACSFPQIVLPSEPFVSAQVSTHIHSECVLWLPDDAVQSLSSRLMRKKYPSEDLTRVFRTPTTLPPVRVSKRAPLENRPTTPLLGGEKKNDQNFRVRSTKPVSGERSRHRSWNACSGSC